jgi:hypothetical protein
MGYTRSENWLVKDFNCYGGMIDENGVFTPGEAA